MKLVDQRNGRAVADRVEVAGRLPARLAGLMLRRSFPPGSALVIPKCRQVHTCLVRFPIDLIFLDADGRVLGLEERVAPWRVSGFYRNASRAVELPSGAIRSAGVEVGDHQTNSSE